jgi:hypothetical protein
MGVERRVRSFCSKKEEAWNCGVLRGTLLFLILFCMRCSPSSCDYAPGTKKEIYPIFQLSLHHSMQQFFSQTASIIEPNSCNWFGPNLSFSATSANQVWSECVCVCVHRGAYNRDQLWASCGQSSCPSCCCVTHQKPGNRESADL